jgi:hypothetical protein
MGFGFGDRATETKCDAFASLALNQIVGEGGAA